MYKMYLVYNQSRMQRKSNKRFKELNKIKYWKLNWQKLVKEDTEHHPPNKTHRRRRQKKLQKTITCGQI